MRVTNNGRSSFVSLLSLGSTSRKTISMFFRVKESIPHTFVSITCDSCFIGSQVSSFDTPSHKTSEPGIISPAGKIQYEDFLGSLSGDKLSLRILLSA